ncbi:uncharacterized protein K460DRAFT_367220 [Cucurbitaria berberidis CBS 394.84]|uniref:Uncharacterized protein n=1 Tax=Cucurbitaria berberidis CBS 394.84 TaxID=1168544 RepID=A0A9P4GHU6_9PLEO|nr:uncharacterized protein K460DRAFT_367220 [Cucurbitaria berberidis CBS 394.84]KAF1846433.1 hypothetical protein K460DRAFT_367220 [Cucurbitaria berberidis CBS 394.84]
MSRTAKRDIQGYIMGQYKAVDKSGHELTNPTGTKFVFCLGLDNDDVSDSLEPDAKIALEEYVNAEEDNNLILSPVRRLRHATTTSQEEPLTDCVEHYIEDYTDDGITVLSTIDEVEEDDLSDSSSDITAVELSNVVIDRKARLMRSHRMPSLAQIIASADPNDLPSPEKSDTESDSVSDYGDDLEDITQKVDYHRFLPLADSDEGLEDNSKQTSSTESATDTVVDIEYPRNNDHKSLLKRHDGKVSLASLIASAKDDGFLVDDDLDPDEDADISPSSHRRVSYYFAVKPCLDPQFSGHGSCHSHEQRAFGRSAASAVRTLRDRFVFKHHANGHAKRHGGTYRKWNVAKWETGAIMVHGPSSLRNEVVYEDDDDVEEEDVEVSSISLPVVTHDGPGDGLNSVLSNSSEEDVDGPSFRVGEGFDASGSGEDDEADFVFEEGDTLLEADIVQAPSSPVDEIVDEYEHIPHDTENIIPHEEDVTFETPPGPVAAEEEVLEDFENAFDEGDSVYLDKARQDQAARAGRMRIETFNNASREHENDDSSSMHYHTGPILLKTLIDNDEDNKNLSARTSIFSNQTSVTSKSSYESFQHSYSRLIDALDLERDAHDCEDGCAVCMTTLRGFSDASIGRSAVSADHTAAMGNGRKRVISLPLVPSAMQPNHVADESAAFLPVGHGPGIHRSPSRLRNNLGVPDTPNRINHKLDNLLAYIITSHGSEESPDGAQSHVPLPNVESDTIDLTSAPAAYQPIRVSRTKEPTHPEYDEYAATAAHGQEYPTLFNDVPYESRQPRWVGKIKEHLSKAPKKVQQTTRRCVKSTKKLTKTVRYFVPVALSACSPF